ncbi:DedA family protein, partial [Acinetobacter baumannii]
MTEFIINLTAWGGYFGIFLLMVLENVFPPIPSEVIMGLGGIAGARGQMEMVPLIVAGTAGTVVGNYF